MLSRQRSRKRIFQQRAYFLILQALQGFLFYFFSSTSYFGDESNCSDLRKYTYILGALTLTITFIHGLILFLSYLKNNIHQLLNSEDIIHLVYVIVSFGIWIMLWISLAISENCISLIILIWTFTVFIVLGIGCVGCIAWLNVFASMKTK